MISLIYVTCKNLTEAQHIAESMLKERLAGCANIIPKMVSMYHWEGQLEKTEEVVLLLKTATDKVSSVLKRVEELHSYDTPCALEFSVESGLEKYQRWILDETRKD